MTDKRILVSAVIPVRNEAHSIEALIGQLANQALRDIDLEIIICDGRSDDGTRDKISKICTEHSNLRIIDNPLLVTPAGLNAAINAARGNIIVRIDAHSSYASDYIQQCVDTLRTTGADNVGGPWRACGNGLVSRAIAAGFQSPFAVGGALSHRVDYDGPIDSVYLGCWKRSAFERFGLFDEELVRNQDDEHNLRIMRGGGRIHQSSTIRSWYTPRNSLSALFRQYFQYGYWKVKVIQKHRLPASPRHMVPGAFVLFACLAWTAGFLHPFGWWIYLGVLGLYTLLNIVFSTFSSRNNWTILPLMPAVIFIYHFAYGTGFLLGLWDFYVFRRSPRQSMAVLTRQAVTHADPQGKP